MLLACALPDGESPVTAPADPGIARAAVAKGYGGQAVADPDLARDEVRCYIAYIEVAASIAGEAQEAAADLIAQAQFTLYAAYVVERATGKDDAQALASVRGLRADNREEVGRLARSPATANPLLRRCDSRRTARLVAIKPFTIPPLKDATTDRI
ncbi:hypothetical protein SAMN07250955_10197 [Arboricoccus pini]|uniref:Uncharacterized protein n=2 Tax=Arboricoccus pini TaxID=1963835 RepID=A0A212PWY1_9PROT|nr:hypothetical protein SAMN07250955_10197 [Arboricoccus pini]